MKPESKDIVLKNAKKRVQLKQHVIIYMLANVLLWAVFFFLSEGEYIDHDAFLKINLFILIVWSVILIVHYFYCRIKLKKNTL